jgi:hypothetical protein
MWSITHMRTHSNSVQVEVDLLLLVRESLGLPVGAHGENKIVSSHTHAHTAICMLSIQNNMIYVTRSSCCNSHQDACKASITRTTDKKTSPLSWPHTITLACPHQWRYHCNTHSYVNAHTAQCETQPRPRKRGKAGNSKTTAKIGEGLKAPIQCYLGCPWLGGHGGSGKDKRRFPEAERARPFFENFVENTQCSLKACVRLRSYVQVNSGAMSRYSREFRVTLLYVCMYVQIYSRNVAIGCAILSVSVQCL